MEKEGHKWNCWGRPAKRHAVELFTVAGVNEDDAVWTSNVRNASVLVRRGVVTAQIQAIDGVGERHALRVGRLRKYEQHL